MVFRRTLLRKRSWTQGRITLPRSRRISFGKLVGQTLLKRESTVKVPNLLLDKAYLIPLTDTHTWTYTLPSNVIGAFIRLFAGVFMRQGDLLGLLKILGQCARVQPVQSEKTYEISYPSFIAYPRATISTTNELSQLRLEIPASFLPVRARGLRAVKMATFALKAKRPLRFPLRKLKTKLKIKTLAKLSRKVQKKKIKVLRPTLAFQGRAVWSELRRVRRVGVKRQLRFQPQLRRLSLHTPVSGLVARGLMLKQAPALATPDLSHQNLHFWNLLQRQPTLTYSLKYCRLSRRVRKILKNKYRYAKYFFMIAPYKRRLYTLHLWKYVLQFHDERSLTIKLNELFKNFTHPDSESLLWSLFYIQQRLTLKKLLGR